MTPEQFNAFLNELGNQAQPIALKVCDRVATKFQADVKRDTPKGETLKLVGSVKKVPQGADKIRVFVDINYGVPVDKGHKTRQGTGRAPNYKPKAGGKPFVQANPFFTKNKDKLIADKTLAQEFKKDFVDYMRSRVPR